MSGGAILSDAIDESLRGCQKSIPLGLTGLEGQPVA